LECKAHIINGCRQRMPGIPASDCWLICNVTKCRDPQTGKVYSGYFDRSL